MNKKPNRSLASRLRKKEWGRIHESKRYHKRKSQGLCVVCGEKKDREQSVCSSCVGMRKEIRKRHFLKCLKKGVCINCGGPSTLQYGCSDCNKKRIGKTWSKKYPKRRQEYLNRRSKENPLIRIAVSLRSRFGMAFKGFLKGKRKASSVRNLGCSLQSFCSYLETKFQDGMTLDNYGKWHIDHIVPLSKFNLLDEDQQKRACHYTNLQPLWAHDNIVKRDHLIH